MATQVGIPEAAWNFLSDMVDNCCQAKPGQEVLILAHKDGLYGGDNLIDEEALAWVSTAFTSRGCRCSILWVDDPQDLHEWRYPPVVKAAVAGADILINTSFQMAVEEIAEFRKHIEEVDTWMVRLFPVTAPLMLSKWAQTPYELVCMIRHISSEPFMKHMSRFVMTDPNGTHLEGFTLDPTQREGIPGMPYNSWRRDASHYLPCPEWVHPPVNCKDVNGDFYFHAMLSWWSRYIGIKPEWDEDIHIVVENSRMTAIEGPQEAKLLKSFLTEMETKVGDGIWKFDTFHFGIHPNAKIEKYQCPNDLYRRTIEHSDCCNLHWHIGSAGGNEKYNFYPHITGDIRRATLTVGDTAVYKDGWLCCQDDPRLKHIMAKYPGRPGIPVNPNTL